MVEIRLVFGHVCLVKGVVLIILIEVRKPTHYGWHHFWGSGSGVCKRKKASWAVVSMHVLAPSLPTVDVASCLKFYRLDLAATENLELWTQIHLFSLKLLFARVLCHGLCLRTVIAGDLLSQSVEMALSRRLEIWSQPMKSKGNLGKACNHLGESIRNQTPLSANLCLLPFWSSAGGRRTTEVGTNWKQTLMEEDSWVISFMFSKLPIPTPSLQQFLQTFTASRKTREAGNSFSHQGSF